jgi:hypothetical protein
MAERDRSFALATAAANEERLLAEFGRGFWIGAEEILDQLAGCPRFATDCTYDGERPPELVAWIATMRRRIEAPKETRR